MEGNSISDLVSLLPHVGSARPTVSAKLKNFTPFNQQTDPLKHNIRRIFIPKWIAERHRYVYD
jgi:hypothetical protein